MCHLFSTVFKHQTISVNRPNLFKQLTKMLTYIIIGKIKNTSTIFY